MPGAVASPQRRRDRTAVDALAALAVLVLHRRVVRRRALEAARIVRSPRSRRHHDGVLRIELWRMQLGRMRRVMVIAEGRCSGRSGSGRCVLIGPGGGGGCCGHCGRGRIAAGRCGGRAKRTRRMRGGVVLLMVVMMRCRGCGGGVMVLVMLILIMIVVAGVRQSGSTRRHVDGRCGGRCVCGADITADGCRRR